MKAQLESLFVQVLPDRLPSGEAVLYLELSRHNPSEYSADDTVRSWHYLVLSAMRKHPELAHSGFVITGNLAGAGYSNLDLGVPEAIASAVSHCMPLRLSNLFIINPPFLLQMVIPVIKIILSRKLGDRVHAITDTDDLYSVHNLDPNFMHFAVGGRVSDERSAEYLQSLLAEDLSV